MNDARTPSVPDVADRHRRMLAWALLFLGARYMTAVAIRRVDPSTAELLGWAEIGFILAAVGFIIPIFVWKARNRSSPDWSLYRDPDGFVAESLVRAQGASWTVLFLTLIVFEYFARRTEWLSPGLVLEAVLATMLVSFSVAFLYLDRDPGDA
ncbi:MAG TPA: hypothetical protein VJ925_03165 [Longimicrobiales bacterium]|nr:hypothetical protein [Longimicrobiales bacterium]